MNEHRGPSLVEVNSSTCASPLSDSSGERECPSQLAHHLGSESSETGSGRATFHLDGGCSVIRMASEAPEGAKSFSCQGSELVAVSAAIHDADGFGSGRRVHP